MHKLGHCGGDARLMEIISHHLEVHECFNHEEDDAGGYIADFKRRARARENEEKQKEEEEEEEVIEKREEEEEKEDGEVDNSEILVVESGNITKR
ncbi:hypothetical protein G5I_01858 [Acromyrmex echinatior]|uniref:Uncharacterized protein n=1 Tax=Acromyrmex echinatior TaxID=103372 RepID=F4W8S5_ACREC|nr:hypothetical protein G5I_01858 [Acromyrmex echinatior]